MNTRTFYICQTFVEDSRMDFKTFNERVVNPLKSILKNSSELNLCLHPRSDKSLYEDLFSFSNVKEDKFSTKYFNEEYLFIGHYSTIIFNLIMANERVLLINLDWDPLPEFIYESSSLCLHWADFIVHPQKLNLDLISYSRPNRQFQTMFENSYINNTSIKNLLDLIF